MISDNSLEYNPQWEAIADQGIGGPEPYVAPKVFIATPATPANQFLSVTIEGGSYTDMMAATHRPLMPAFYPDIYYDYEFDITPDPNVADVQALEFEASYADQNDYYYNNSMQLNYVNPSGMIQAYGGPENVWANTGIVVPKFTPNVPTPVKVSYLVDIFARVMSTLAVTIAGKRYPLPSLFQRISGEKRGWTPGVYVQFQLDLASKGGSMTNKYSNINLNWL
jgi:hypothetical protein